MVDITIVHLDAVRVDFDQLRPGDWVFDAFGGRHKVAKARVLKRGALSLKREDYPFTEHIELDEHSDHSGQIVIVPAHGWTQDGAGYRKTGEVWPGPGQDYELGEFTETCRCGEVFGSGAGGDKSEAGLALAIHADEANGRSIYNA
jgi:hypothetical protein